MFFSEAVKVYCKMLSGVHFKTVRSNHCVQPGCRIHNNIQKSLVISVLAMNNLKTKLRKKFRKKLHGNKLDKGNARLVHLKTKH